jgi:hypothetical protein
VLVAVAVFIADCGDRQRQRLGWCCSLLARPPPGILRLAVSAPLPLPGVRRSRALLRTLLLEVPRTAFLLQRPQLVQSMRVQIPRHRQFHSGLRQKLPQVPHKLADSGLTEKPFRVVPIDTPVDGEVHGPLPILLVVEGH